MNRLLRIGFDTFLTSVTPILGWFLLGILVDKNLINIFSLIYPIQFVISASVAAITVGGKAIGKEIANRNSTQIVHYVGIVLNKIYK